MVTEQQRPTEEEIRERLLAFSKRLMASKRQMQEEMKHSMEDPHFKAMIEELKKKNEERGTPIINL